MLTGSPPVTATPMTSSLLASTPEYRQHIEAVQPLKGVGTATDVAQIAVMLASEDVGWVTGIAMPVDGGFLCQ
jgi:NAD(P)-dependent dehydrogenase (short-subunit alcohol dehydrogenase family)